MLVDCDVEEVDIDVEMDVETLVEEVEVVVPAAGAEKSILASPVEIWAVTNLS